MENENLAWMKAIGKHVEELETSAGYVELKVQIQGGYIVGIKSERSAKSVDELARFNQRPVGSRPSKGE